MLQLVGVDHGPDGLHLAVGDVEGEDVDHTALGVVGDRAGLAVDPTKLAVGPHLLPAAEQPEHEPGDPFCPGQRLGQRPGLAAAVADHDHVGGEQFEQVGQVAAVGCGEEPAGHLAALLAGGLETRLALVDVAPGAEEDLPAVRFGLAGDVRDLLIVVAEHLVQQEHRAFGRRQALHQDKEGHGQRVRHLCALRWIRFAR